MLTLQPAKETTTCQSAVALPGSGIISPDSGAAAAAAAAGGAPPPAAADTQQQTAASTPPSYIAAGAFAREACSERFYNR